MFRKKTDKVLLEIPSFLRLIKEIEFECNKSRGTAS